jgi:hypothetical protein
MDAITWSVGVSKSNKKTIPRGLGWLIASGHAGWSGLLRKHLDVRPAPGQDHADAIGIDDQVLAVLDPQRHRGLDLDLDETLIRIGIKIRARFLVTDIERFMRLGPGRQFLGTGLRRRAPPASFRLDALDELIGDRTLPCRADAIGHRRHIVRQRPWIGRCGVWTNRRVRLTQPARIG